MHKKIQQIFLDLEIISFGNEISSKNSFSVVSEILILFVKMLIPDNQYSISVKASL